MDQRVDFKMPELGWSGAGAQFPTIWLTWKLKIGQQMTFAKLHKPNKQARLELAAGVEQLGLFEAVTA
jgi:hypothetical protein